MEEIIKKNYINLSEEESKCINRYVEITKSELEIAQLFEVFCVHLSNLRSNFDMYGDGHIFYKSNNPDLSLNYSHQIIFNSFLISYLSAAKTFIENLRRIAKKVYSNEKNEIELYINNIYDENFNYRLMMMLRDFSQHKTLPISFKNNIYKIDVYQISNSFCLGGAIKKDFKKIIEMEKTCGLIHLDIVRAIINFTITIFEIYLFFIGRYKEIEVNAYKELKLKIKTNPKIVCKDKKMYNYIFFYQENEIHAFHLENPNKHLSKQVEKTRKRLEYQIKQSDNFRKGLPF